MGYVCVLLGLFDGLHLGHMSAVNELLRFGGERVVYTFDSLSVSTKGGRKLLLTDKEKREALIKLGVDRVVSEDFLKIKDIPGREFAEKILCRELNAEKVIVGENFRFGKGASDGAQELKSYCEALNIGFSAVPVLEDGGEPISTTRIRKLIESGDLKEAARLLGRSYSVGGIIKRGAFWPSAEKALPRPGEYKVSIRMNDTAEAVEALFDGTSAYAGKGLSGAAEMIFE